MKWFKHISDSLDDPFIFSLMNKHGADGYLVFFGILEIYAREFQVKDGWSLSITIPYLKQKLCKRQSTTVIKCLEYIATHGKLPTNSYQTPDKLLPNSEQTQSKLPTNSEKVFENSGKWDVTLKGDEVTIFIPKFKELMDETTLRKLSLGERKIGSESGVSPKKLQTELEVDKEEDKDIHITSLNGTCPHSEIIALYHKTLPSLPQVRKWDDRRKKILSARWKEDPEQSNLEFWERFFNHVKASDFLTGKKSTWCASLEWLIKPSNFIKIIEGNYDN